MPEARARNIGIALGLIGAVLFSGKAILAKLLYRHGVDALDVLALRMLFSVPLFALLGLFETRKAQRAGKPSPSRKQWLAIIVLGFLGYYLASLLDFWGLEYVPASLERLILYLNPTIVILLGVLFFGKHPGARQWIALAVSYAGVVLVFGESLRIEGDHILLGGALVLGSAVSYALYLALSGELVHALGSLRLVAFSMCVSTVVALIHYFLVRDTAHLLALPWPVIVLSLLNAVFCTFLPVTFTMSAIARVGAGMTALLSVAGPVSLLFLGAWILGESITWLQLVGTAVVLGGIVMLTRPAANSVPLGK